MPISFHHSIANRELMANAIRALSMDAVQLANSGHPGAPMGMAEMATVLWSGSLKHNPANPKWFDRDRFVLSNGHASMLLYSVLHLTGYDLSIDDLKQFRKLHSKTPGHPEHGITPGVETTTGPLGQGIATAVGMALAEKLMGREFNEASHKIVDHKTYVFMGDGCLMEGLSQEAISLAGVLNLSKLIVFWDDNRISIDGDVEGWFTDDTGMRFNASGWNVIRNVDGHDADALHAAVLEAIANADDDHGPTLICCLTQIGKGSPNKAGTADVHGAALGTTEIAETRSALDWPHAPFEIPKSIYALWSARESGASSDAAWNERFRSYTIQFPAKANEFTRRMRGEAPVDFGSHLPKLIAEAEAQITPVASRKASQQSIERLAKLLPELLGGSADLTGSNLTDWSDCKSVGAYDGGNYIHWGVREFGMAAAMNGMALHGGYKVFGGTFLVFSDYCRNAIRLAALMKLPVTYVFTHDSIGLGEDGPTHQPVEHVASLRLIPNIHVWRPADAVETQTAWNAAVTRDDGPSVLALSRQNLPPVTLGHGALGDIARGGYILRNVRDPQVVLVATGSEVHLAVEAAELLEKSGIATRVVSLPCTNLFDIQTVEYQDAVIPHDIPAVAIEAGHVDGLRKYVGRRGIVIGMTTFGESAPAKDLYAHFGIATNNIVESASTLVRRSC